MNINITSSMKYIDLEGLSPLQIIKKYEELLLQRENIIQQLSNQLNESQQKYIEVSETIEVLSNKNKELNEIKLKCDKTLNQQRTDKDLLFIKLNNLISENDKLNNLISGKEEKQPQLLTSKKHEKGKNTFKKENINKSNNVIRLEYNLQNKDKKEENKVENQKNEEKDKNIEKPKIDDKKEEKIENNNSNSDIKGEKNEKKLEEKIEDKTGEKKEENNENKNDDKKEDKIEDKKDDKIEDKKEDKKEDIKEDKKEDVNKENKEEIDSKVEKEDKKEEVKINDDKKEEFKSQSEKRVITIDPEKYLATRKRKKHKGGKKLMSETISYDPVFK